MLLTTVVRSRNLIITAIFSPIFATLSTHYYPLPLLPPCCSPISPHWCTLLYPSPCNLTYPLSPPPPPVMFSCCSPPYPSLYVALYLATLSIHYYSYPPPPPCMLLFTFATWSTHYYYPPPPMLLFTSLRDLVYPLLPLPPPQRCSPVAPPPHLSMYVVLSLFVWPWLPSHVLLLLLHPTSPCMLFFPFLCDLDYPAMFSCCSSTPPLHVCCSFPFCVTLTTQPCSPVAPPPHLSMYVVLSLFVWPWLPSHVLLLVLHPTSPCMLFFPFLCDLDYPAMFSCCSSTPPLHVCCSFPFCVTLTTQPCSPVAPPPHLSMYVVLSLFVWPWLPSHVLLLLLHATFFPFVVLFIFACVTWTTQWCSPVAPPPHPSMYAALSLLQPYQPNIIPPPPPMFCHSPPLHVCCSLPLFVSYLSITTPALHVAPHQTPPCDACCSFPLCTYPLSPPPPLAPSFHPSMFVALSHTLQPYPPTVSPPPSPPHAVLSLPDPSIFLLVAALPTHYYSPIRTPEEHQASQYENQPPWRNYS